MAEFNPDEFLKSRGYTDDQIKTLPTKPPAAEPPATTPPSTETGDYLTDTLAHGAVSAARGLGTLALNVGELGAHYVGNRFDDPEAMRKGREELREFIKPPEDESPLQTGFRLAGEYLPLGPLGRLTPLESLAARWIPPATARFIPGAGFVATPSRAGQVARGVTRYVGDPALAGAAGGMTGDPEHPEKGAEEGAITAGTLGSVEGLLRRGGGLTRTLLANLAYAALHGLTGLHYHPAAGPITHSATRRVGNMLVNSSGKIVGSLAAPAGRVVGKALKGPDDEETNQ